MKNQGGKKRNNRVEAPRCGVDRCKTIWVAQQKLRLKKTGNTALDEKKDNLLCAKKQGL